jgi:hypothetical protein
VPLAGDKYAQQMLAPIKPEIFYELFNEGWPLDLLMRVLIERIEIEGPDGVEVMENSPALWASATASDQRTSVESDGPTGYYDRFLRACALARTFQVHGLIYLKDKKHFQPASSVISSTPDTRSIEQAAKDGLVWERVEDEAKGLEREDGAPEPTAPESRPATVKSGRPAENQWQLGKTSTKTVFGLSARPGTAHGTADFDVASPVGALKGQLDAMACFSGPDKAAEKFVKVMMIGFNVTSGGTEEPQPKSLIGVRLVMRSLMGAMYAAATEAEAFDSFRAAYERQRVSNGWAPLPESQLHPVLTIVAKDGETLDPLAVQVRYRDRRFVITDVAPPLPGASPTWNRDVFRLLVQLSFLATADPTAFQSPSLIQLH